LGDVAETHVIEQLRECRELVMPELSKLRIEQQHQMLRVLSMGAAHQSAGVALLKEVLRADIERLVFPALEVAEVTSGMDATLAEVLSDARVTPATRRTIEEKIPYPTTALVATAVVVTCRILHMLPADTPVAERARWRLRLGVVLAQAGRADEALRHIETTADCYRILVCSRYLPDLARALHKLGILHGKQDHYVSALLDTERAIKYYRKLVARNPGDHRAGLAASLNDLGRQLAELGRHTKALAPLTEAVERYWELADIDDRYRRELRQASADLRRSQSHVPLDVGVLETVVKHHRDLVETDRDRYLPELARSLCDLSNGYAKQKRHEQARGCLREALDYYRTLSESPDDYRPGLAACLNDLGATLTKLGRYDEALRYAKEAVDMHQSLAENNRARYRPEPARSLDNLTSCLTSMGRRDQALPYAKEAVTLYRRLAEIDPDSYRPALARALSNWGVSLSDSLEAVALYQELVEIDSRQYTPLLAQALRRLAGDYSALGRRDDADRCRQDADDLETGNPEEET
jgi:tetratricopeptide (TPR) repeat protein